MQLFHIKCQKETLCTGPLDVASLKNVSSAAMTLLNNAFIFGIVVTCFGKNDNWKGGFSIKVEGVKTVSAGTDKRKELNRGFFIRLG